MHVLAGSPALIVGAATLALGVISGPSLAQTATHAREDAATNDQVIITNMLKHRFRVREFL